MKYIKKFETEMWINDVNISQLKKGDYIVYKYGERKEKVGCIKNSSTNKIYFVVRNADNTRIGVKYTNIVRFATQSEIDDYMIQKKANKYNI